MTGILGALLGLGIAFGAVPVTLLLFAVFVFAGGATPPRWWAYTVLGVFPCAVLVGYVVGATA